MCALGKRLLSEGMSKPVKWKRLAQVGAEKMFFLFLFSQMFEYVLKNYFEGERLMISSICMLMVIVFARLRKQAGKWVLRVATEALE